MPNMAAVTEGANPATDMSHNADATVDKTAFDNACCNTREQVLADMDFALALAPPTWSPVSPAPIAREQALAACLPHDAPTAAELESLDMLAAHLSAPPSPLQKRPRTSDPTLDLFAGYERLPDPARLDPPVESVTAESAEHDGGVPTAEEEVALENARRQMHALEGALGTVGAHRRPAESAPMARRACGDAPGWNSCLVHAGARASVCGARADACAAVAFGDGANAHARIRLAAGPAGTM